MELYKTDDTDESVNETLHLWQTYFIKFFQNVTVKQSNRYVFKHFYGIYQYIRLRRKVLRKDDLIREVSTLLSAIPMLKDDSHSLAKNLTGIFFHLINLMKFISDNTYNLTIPYRFKKIIKNKVERGFIKSFDKQKR